MYLFPLLEKCISFAPLFLKVDIYRKKMNPLETLKDQLKMKPRVHERDPVVVRLEQIVGAPAIIDKRTEGYNRDQLIERIKQNKLSK